MGSIRVRPETGTLFLDFRYRGSRCREQTLLEDAPANRRRLEGLLRRIEEDIAAGSFEYRRYFPDSRLASRFDAPPERTGVQARPATDSGIPSSTPSFAEFAEVWFLENRVGWKRSYVKTVRQILDTRLLPRFGTTPLDRIAKADVLAFRAELAVAPGRVQEQLSNRRINAILTPLRMILLEAADRYDFPPAWRNIRPLRISRSDVEPFTLEEVQSILETVREDFRPYYTVRFFAGLRTGEVDGLQWKHVDFEQRLVMVRETIVDGRQETTKTPGSVRDVQMSAPVLEALKAQHAVTGAMNGYVFCNREGKPLDHTNITNRVWYPLLRHLGLKKRRPYQTRHTAATLWLAAGENPEWIARQLGHASTEMLFKVYSRFVPNLTRQDGSAMDRLLRARGLVERTQDASGGDVP